MSGQVRFIQPRARTFRLFNHRFLSLNFLMSVKASLCFRAAPSILRSKLLEGSFQERFSCGLSECCQPEGFSPASLLHLPIPPHQALLGGGQVVVLLKEGSPCSEQPVQTGHFAYTPHMLLWFPLPGIDSQAAAFSDLSKRHLRVAAGRMAMLCVGAGFALLELWQSS